MNFPTFREFQKLILEEVNTKTGYESAITSAWNHFSGSGHLHGLVRNYGNSTKTEKIRKSMRGEIEEARKDKTHPLNYKNAHSSMFKGNKKEKKKDEEEYYREMHRAADTVHGMVSGSEHLHESVRTGHVMVSVGKARGTLSNLWKKHGAQNTTSKSDICLVDRSEINKNGELKPGANGSGINISLKKGSGSQIGSSSINETSAIHHHAFRQLLDNDPSYMYMTQKRKEEHENWVLKKLEEAKQKSSELSGMTYLEDDREEDSTPERKKIIDEVNGRFERSRDEIGKIFDEIHRKHPKLKDNVIREYITGVGKFGNDSAMAANFLVQTPTFDKNNNITETTKVTHHSELKPHPGCRLEVSHITDAAEEGKKEFFRKGKHLFIKRKPRKDGAVMRVRGAKGTYLINGY